MLLIFSSSTLLAPFSTLEIQIEREVIHHPPLEKAPASPRLTIHGRQLLKHCSQPRLFFLRETMLIQNQNRSIKLGQSKIETSTIDN
ncbi:hypothetical protein ACE6H2_015779 [Prunus campanulata]